MARPDSSSQAAEALLLTARPREVAVTLVRHMPLFPLVFGPPLAAALVEGEPALAWALALPVGLTLAVSLATFRLALPRDLRRVEAMAVLALLFLLAALLSAPAFMALGLPPLDAVFEGMSGITTTGHSMARAAEAWPVAGHVLRSWMQWSGGLAIATAVLALVLDPGLPARQLGRVGLDERDFLSSSRLQARQLLVAYVALTVIGALGAALLLPSAWEGVVITLAAVSTGGFAPRADSLAGYGPLAQGYVLLLSSTGAVSLLFFVFLGRDGPRAALDLGSLQRVGAVLAALAAAYALLHVAQEGFEPLALYRRLLDLVSGLTTAGFSTGAMPAQPLLLVVILLAMLIGGDIGSTGGGLKISRVIVLGQAVRYTLARARMPDTAVYPLKSGGKPVDEETLVGILALLLLYLAALLFIWGLFLGHGYPAMPALFDTVSTLSTVGLSTGLIDADLPPALKLALTLGMWLGRLEFVAVLVLFLPRTWLSRR